MTDLSDTIKTSEYQNKNSETWEANSEGDGGLINMTKRIIIFKEKHETLSWSR